MSGLAQTLSSTISALRSDEIKASKPFRIISSITSAIAQVPLLISPVVAFAMFQGVTASSSQVLDATRLFSALSLIILFTQPLFTIFEAVLDMSAALGAFGRIDKFLVQTPCRARRNVLAPTLTVTPHGQDNETIELQDLRRESTTSSYSAVSGNSEVELQSATISWSGNHPVLNDISFSIKKGQLALIVGPVASGKSTLLKALLGEVPHVSGCIEVGSERLSWCGQTPWLMVC